MSEPFINKLTLYNFKCYKELTFPLKAGVNILYGANGTGKTSLLEAINLAASSFVDRLRIVEKRTFQLSDIRLETQKGVSYPLYQLPVTIKATGTILNQPISWSKILKKLPKLNASIDLTEPIYMGRNQHEQHQMMSELSERVRTALLKQEEITLPIIAYFSTQRLFNQRTHADHIVLDGRQAGYYNAFNATNIRKQTELWFKKAEYEQYQKRRVKPDFIDHSLEDIRSLLLEHFEEWQHIYYLELPSDTGMSSCLYIVHQDGHIMPETLLSDGYRNFLWLFLEIAWRCYMLNPFLGKNTFSETPGIITIDEVDLHLHPKWQQRVLAVLHQAFPKIQFVVTTHSSLILSSVNAHVLMLYDDKILIQNKLYGMKPNYILENYMQIMDRLPEHQPLIQQYFHLINQEKGKSEEALKLRKQLENSLSMEVPLFTEADALIDFLSY
ncbi:MAG: hypothetical protein RLZZ628_1827 [Bacteroidota bacterium]|jgi:predicted ATP-binding protein involved in virulence